MDLSHLLLFNAALLVALFSPGPAMLITLKTALSSGRKAGIFVGLGLSTIAATWTLAALLGLETLFVLFPWAYVVIKSIGAAFLIYTAYKMWMGARDPIQTHINPAPHAFRQGALLNLLNPKSVLFAAAVLVVIFPKEMSVGENIAVVGNHFVVEVLFYSGFSILMSTPRANATYMSAKLYIDRISASLLSALGLRLLLSR